MVVLSRAGLLSAVLGTAAALLTPFSAGASPDYVCVTIAASETEPWIGHVDPWIGERTLYLWSEPCIAWSSGSEFGLVTNFEIVAFVPRPGVVNTGTPTSPVLTYADCLTDDTVVAEIVVRDATGAGGTVCFGPSDQTGVNCSYHICDIWCVPHLYTGFRTTGFEPCYGPTSVSASSWGSVKSTYR